MAKKKTLSQSEIKKKIDDGHKRVETWRELHGLLEGMRDTAWIFRGVLIFPGISGHEVKPHSFSQSLPG